jgi:peptide deformylase
MKLIKDIGKLREPLLPKPMSQSDVDSITEKLTTELTKHGGLGLSANQIGLTDRVCLINVKDPLILVNPKVTQASKETVVYLEQCLSLDKTMAKPVRTLRHESFTVECDNLGTVIFSPDKKEGGQWKDSEEFYADEGLLECVCAQHEIDHLNGILITDSKRKYSTTFIAPKKYGRNERVMVKLSDGTTEFMKYKKAESLIAQGAEIL